MAPGRDRRSPLALVVLALLAERPLHPYAMQQLIKLRGKTSLVNVTQRNSVHQVIDRLVASGLAEIETTEQVQNRPERTIYRITETGLRTVRRWIVEMLGADKPEYPAFPAALSLLALIPPAQARSGLTARRDLMRGQLDEAGTAHAAAIAMGLPHLFLLDDEYRLAMLDAELSWLDALLEEFERGELDWSEAWIAEIAARFEPGT